MHAAGPSASPTGAAACRRDTLAPMHKRIAQRALQLLLALLALPAGAEPRLIELQLAGRPTVLDIYEPDQPASGAVVLAHGFTRSRATLADHAEALRSAGVLVAVPDLPYLVDSRDNARALTQLVAQLRSGQHAPPVPRVVLVGFSAGALAAILAASAPGVVGYVGLDPFDRPNGIGLAAAQTLQTPTILLRAPASACNAYSIAEPWVAALPHLVEDRLLANATHCDFEAPTDWICRAACGATDPARQQLVRDTLLAAARRWLARPPADAQRALAR